MLELKLFDASPAWTIQDDTLIGFDLAFTRGLRLRGIDPTCETDEALGATSARLRDALSALPEGATARFVSMELAGYEGYLDGYAAAFASSEAGAYLASKKVAQVREAVRARERELYCFVSTPPVAPGSAFHSKVLGRRAGGLIERARALHVEKVHEARRVQLLVARGLAPARVDAEPLAEADVFDALWRLANPLASVGRAPPGFRADGSLRAQLFASGLRNHYDCFEREGGLHRVVTLKTPPREISPSQILELQTLPFRHVLVVTLRRVSDAQARRRVETNRRQGHELDRLLAKLRGENRHAAMPDHALVEQQLNSNDILARLNAGERLFDVAVQVWLSAPDRTTLDRHTETVLARFRACGQAEGAVEELRGRFAFLSMLPGHESLLGERWHAFLGSCAADLLPVYASPRGAREPLALLSTRTNEVVGFHPLDPVLRSWNATIVGATGSGKSFTARTLLLGWLASGHRMVIATRGRDYHRFAEIFGGTICDVSAEDPSLALGPFPPPAVASVTAESIEHVASILAVMVQDDHGALSRLDRRLLFKTTEAVYRQLAAVPNAPAPTFREWLEAVVLVAAEDPDTRPLVGRIVRQMLFWVDGPFGRAFCRNRPAAPTEQLSVWNLEHIRDADTQGVVLALLSGVIAQSIKAAPTIVVLDEVWSLFKSEAGAELVETLYRTVRKEGSAIWTISQSVNDYLALPEATRSAVLNNSVVKLFLPLDASENDLVSSTFKLSARESDLLGSLVARPGVYSELLGFFGDRRQVLKVEPTGIEYWLSTSHPRDIAFERRAISRHPNLSRWELLKRLARSYPHGAVHLSASA